MIATLLFTAFVMGLAGGPHCIVMCGAACQAMQSQKAKSQPVLFSQAQSGSAQPLLVLRNTPWSFYLGRFVGYALLGAIAAQSVRTLAWLANHSSLIQPLWTFFHALIFAWGVLLILFGQQPAWAVRWAQQVWAWIQQKTYHAKWGYFSTGMLWALLPCGLLYSALMMASLQSQWLQGALVMLAFATGSAFVLMLGPWCLALIKQHPKLKGLLSEAWGMRISGLILITLSLIALWMDVMHHDKLWCQTL